MSGSEERELPEGWVETTVEAIVSVEDARRVPLNATERSKRAGSYPYYGANGQVGTIDDYLFEGSHILVAEDGGYFFDPHKGVAYIASGKFWVNNHAHVLQAMGGIPPEYIKHALNQVKWNDYVSGTTRPKLTQAALRRVLVHIPPLNEQKRIVARIDALTEKSREAREALEEVPVLLDKLRQSILASAFRGDLTREWRAKNPDVEPASVLLERIRQERRKKWEEAQLAKFQAKGKLPKDDSWKKKYVEPQPVDTTDLPDLPEGWCWSSVDELTLMSGGITKGQKRKGGVLTRRVPYLRVANVQRGSLSLADVAEIEATEDEIAQLRLVPGDILLNEGGDIDKLGRGWIWEGQLECCIHQNHVFRARPVSHEVNPKFISYFTNTYGQTYFLTSGKQTTNLASVSMTRVKACPIPVAPAKEMDAAVSEIQRLFTCAEGAASTLNAFDRRLNHLDSAILAKAFRGELVPQDPNDEPASVLLERIAAERAAAGRAAAGRAAAESKGKKPRSRLRPVLGELSAEAKAARAPLRPEELVEAQHDRVHRDPGRARAARTVRNSRRGTT